MNKYQKGRRFEYEFMAMLKANGYEALRTAGSHSPFDIVVVKYTPDNAKIAHVAFVQCKIKKLSEPNKQSKYKPENQSGEDELEEPGNRGEVFSDLP